MAGVSQRFLLFIFTLVFQLSPIFLFSQNVVGVPEILNYTKQNYNAGSQNTEIAQGKNGIMYFANNFGLLVFDGVYWDLYRLQKGTALKSIAIDEKGRIFTGGQGEIGFFSADANGKLCYHALNELLPVSDNSFSEVWSVSIYKGHIFFRTDNRIFEYTGSKIIVHKGSYWSFVGQVGKRLLAYDSGRGLVELNIKSWTQILPRSKLEEVRSIVEVGSDSLLISTLWKDTYLYSKQNLTLFSTPAAQEIKANGVSCLTKLANGNIAFGTRKGGVYIVNKYGRLIQRITKRDGLQSLNILTIKEDRDANIWVGLDNGTDIICYADAIKHIYPEQENRSSGFTSAIFNNTLYLGTTAGLYYLPMNAIVDFSKTYGDFNMVANAEGQIWQLSKLYGKLFVGGSAGAFLIEKGLAKPLDKKTGYWCFQALNYSNKSYVLAGNYAGVSLFEEQGENFNASMSGLAFESARFLVQHQGLIWVAHPYKGLFKIAIEKNQKMVVKRYEDKNKLLSANHNKIFAINQKLILINGKGIFEYDDQKQDYVTSVFFTRVFGHQLLDYLYQDRYGNIWFTGNKKIGVLSKRSSYTNINYIDELENRITFNYENINVVDSNNVIIGAENGFFHLNLKAYSSYNPRPEVLIRSVRMTTDKNDSLVYGGFSKQPEAIQIGHQVKNITISYAATSYRHPFNIRYSYFLKGFDNTWSAWNKKTAKEYSNLPPGSYTFYVKCYAGKQNVSKAVAYSFVVLPAWYQTWWARLVYALFACGLLGLLLKYQQKKHFREQQAKLKKQQISYEQEQKRVAVEHRLIVQEKQKEIILLTNEKLQAELDYKNQELASSAMNLVRKIEVLSKLKLNLEHYKSLNNDDKSRKEWYKIIKIIDSEIEHKQEWERFNIHFDNVHNHFLRNLKAYCPDITANELKLSAYLKLNISTKEIAQLMNISVRGVETARFRLRKKLSVSTDTNLADFLIGFNGEE